MQLHTRSCFLQIPRMCNFRVDNFCPKAVTSLRPHSRLYSILYYIALEPCSSFKTESARSHNPSEPDGHKGYGGGGEEGGTGMEWIGLGWIGWWKRVQNAFQWNAKQRKLENKRHTELLNLTAFASIPGANGNPAFPFYLLVRGEFSRSTILLMEKHSALRLWNSWSSRTLCFSP